MEGRGGGVQWCMARPPRDPSLLSWPWGVRPFWVWGSVFRGRVGSLALTHTHNDVAILVQWRTLLSIFLLSRPPPVAPRLLAVFHP